MLRKILGAVAFLVLSVLYSAQATAQSTCSTDGSGAITATSGDCYVQPDEYYMTLYRVGLCTSIPSATTTTAFNTSSCTTIFENAASNRVLVQKGIATPLSGTMTKPPNGAYVAGYIEVAPQFQVKASKVFSGTRVGSSGGSGTSCWSITGSVYVWDLPVTPTLVECGASAGTAGVTTQLMNSFNPTSALYSQTFTGGGVTVSAYLVKSDNMLPTGGSVANANNVSKLLGVAPMAVTVSSSTTSMNTSFDVTSGSTLVLDNSRGATLLFSLEAALSLLI